MIRHCTVSLPTIPARPVVQFIGLAIFGLAIFGLAIFGLAIFGLAIFGSAIFGSETQATMVGTTIAQFRGTFGSLPRIMKRGLE